MNAIGRARDGSAAVFVVFAALAGIAELADAPRWALYSFALVTLIGAVSALVLLWVQQLLQSEEDAAGRFKSAAELLGERDAAVAAIYLLESVARDAPRHYHGPIVELLSAYVRSHTREQAGDEARPSADVQAALTVLGRRTPREGEPEIRLSRTHLRGASLRGGHFERARFRGAHLENTRFEGAQLQGAKFRGAFLQGADFRSDSDLGLPAADLTEAEFPDISHDSTTKWPPGFDPRAAR